MRKVWIGLTAAMVLTTTAAFADGEPEPVRARFTTIQTEDAVRAAACRITTKVRAGERMRPLDVRFLDGRCSREEVPDDVIPLTVSIAARDARYDVVIELASSPDVTPEDARTAVTQFGGTLRTLVRSVPVQAPVVPLWPKGHGVSGATVAGIVFGVGAAVVVGFLVAGAVALGNGLNGLGNMHMGFSGGW